MGEQFEFEDDLTELVSRITNHTEPHQSVLVDIFCSLGVDASYPAIRNLVDVLEAHAHTALETNFPPTKIWSTWLRTLQFAKESLKQLNWKYAAKTARSGNPLGGKFSPYYLTAALMQDPFSGSSEQYRGLTLLLLAVIIQENNIKIKDLKVLANEIRLAGDSKPGRGEILCKLPPYRGKAANLWGKLLSKKIDELSNQKVLENTQKKFISALKILSGYTLNTELNHTGENLIRPSHDDYIEIIDFIDDPQPVLGTLFVANIEELVPSDEPPDKRVIFSEKSDPSYTEPISDAGAEVDAKKSRYWLMRQQSRTPVDGVLLNIIEKRVFYDYLEDSICNGTTESNSAFVLALMYATGLSYEEIHNECIGQDEIFSIHGTYKRRVLRPIDAYKPLGEAKSLIAPLLDVVELPLPNIIRQWFKARFYDEAGQYLISDILGITLVELRSQLQRSLSVLRDKGKYRITQSRIKSGLAVELDVTTKNPLIRHIIAGRKNEDHPVLAYYQALTSEQIINAYIDVIKKMFLGN